MVTGVPQTALGSFGSDTKVVHRFQVVWCLELYVVLEVHGDVPAKGDVVLPVEERK